MAGLLPLCSGSVLAFNRNINEKHLFSSLHVTVSFGSVCALRTHFQKKKSNNVISKAASTFCGPFKVKLSPSFGRKFAMVGTLALLRASLELKRTVAIL
jgi:hypothetical protein